MATRTTRLRWLTGIGLVVTVAAVAGVITLRSGDAASGSTDGDSTLDTAEVVRTDLVEQATYDGTIGRLDGNQLVASASGVVTVVAEADDTIGNGDVPYALDGRPVVAIDGALPMYRTLERWPDTMQLAAMSEGVVTVVPEPGAVIEEGDVLFEIDGEPVVVIYGTVPVYRDLADLPTNLVGDDVAQLETALARLDLVGDIDLTVDDEFTSATERVVEALEESIGATVDGRLRLGEYLVVDGPQVIAGVPVDVGTQVSPQSTVVELADGDPLTGGDVAQLQAALIAFGHADETLPVDGVFSADTEAAVRAFQLAAGLDDDGALDIGEIVFIAEPLRVADNVAQIGSAVSVGAPVLSVTGEELLVTLDLPAADQGALAVGDHVDVELPDGALVVGTITEIASVATVVDGEAVFEAEIELADASVAAGLDEAPVDVHVVTDSVEGVVAVPVAALIVLREGGYAVELLDGVAPRLVAVDPGFFSDGLVEVTGALEPGDLVVMP